MDVISKAIDWLSSRKKIALATVVETMGSSPRPVGSRLVVNKDMEFTGSVSGGCVEAAVITEALNVMDTGLPKLVSFEVDNQTAWNVGLTCGGTLSVLISPAENLDLLTEHLTSQKNRKASVHAINIQSGQQSLVLEDRIIGDLNDDSSVTADARTRLSTGACGYAESDAGWFLRPWLPSPRVNIIGASHIAQTLAPIARLSGFDVTVVDPRSAFATHKRFPGFAPLSEWPDDFFAANPPDQMTAIVTLTHDKKIDDPAIVAALRSNAFYIGALGSRKSHLKRLERLASHGFSKDDMRRIHAPVGLDLGGRQPEEIAVAITAEIILRRYSGSTRNDHHAAPARPTADTMSA